MGDEPKSESEILLYQTEDRRTRLEVRLEESVWLSLNQLAELFQRDKSVIWRHIKNVFEEWELTRERVVANFATTAGHGKPIRSSSWTCELCEQPFIAPNPAMP
ncbi:MAG: hypothetical protein L0Z50_39145 [Verrucomicrobiales bacterium]|nr:hypothetical protein [Verrucomicrobiales bacterium]